MGAVDGRHTNDEAAAAAVVASLVGLSAVFTALTIDLVPSYKDQLNRSGLSLSASPTRFDLRYRF